MVNNFCKFCDGIKPAVLGMCTSCTDEYFLIRSYIESHPQTNIMHIAASTRIPLKKIKLFVDRGNFALNI